MEVLGRYRHWVYRLALKVTKRSLDCSYQSYITITAFSLSSAMDGWFWLQEINSNLLLMLI